MLVVLLCRAQGFRIVVEVLMAFTVVVGMVKRWMLMLCLTLTVITTEYLTSVLFGSVSTTLM